MRDITFKVDENGTLIEYKVLKILVPENSHYKYLVYTNNNIDKFASRFEIINGEIILKPIEEKYEWDYIDENIKEVVNENI